VSLTSSPFGGIPRNWKHEHGNLPSTGINVPPSGGSLEIGNLLDDPLYVSTRTRSPFGGIPRNWKLLYYELRLLIMLLVPPSGGSLEIGNVIMSNMFEVVVTEDVPPSGGSLEIGNLRISIGRVFLSSSSSPFGGIPRNWKHSESRRIPLGS